MIFQNNIQDFFISSNLLIMLIAYLLGSIASGVIISKIFGINDLRKSGSGNIGATNMVRVAGKKMGFYTLICDGAKGLLACYVAHMLSANHNIIFAAGFISIFGHIFPIWLRFKGGKGVATSLAVFCYFDIKLGIGCIICWLLVFLRSRISSLASLMSFLLAPIIAYIISQKISGLTITTLITAILVLFRHKDNIDRILKNKEFKI